MERTSSWPLFGFDHPLGHPLLQSLVERQQLFLGLFHAGDVESHPLQNEGLSILASEDVCLAMHPNHMAIARDKSINRAKGLAAQAGLGEFTMPTFAVVRVQPIEPQHRIFQPFFLRKTEQFFDLRADVEIVDPAIERGHERNGGNLLDEGSVACFRLP